MSELIKKIGIGTVQFGLDYGISNQGGKVDAKEALLILKEANLAGIDMLDTATAYGDSEKLLSSLFKHLPTEAFRVVSKLPANAVQVGESLSASLERLGLDALYGFLFHDFGDFLKKPDLWNQLQEAKLQRKVNKIGFSLYYPFQLEELFSRDIDVDMVQISYNIFDRRFEPLFAELQRRKVEVHVRSAFLQGLFFMPLAKLSHHFREAKPKIAAVQELASSLNIPLPGLLLFFAARHPAIDYVIIGVESKAHLAQNLEALSLAEAVKSSMSGLESLQEEDEQILLPFNWK